MNKSNQVFERLKKNRLIALLAPATAADCLRAYEALDPLGIVLEVAFRTEAAANGLGSVLEQHPEALLLAGTVMTRLQARQAIRAGAAGVVSADYIPEVVEECAASDIMAVPGGLADCGKQLAQKAKLYGCDLFELREKHPYQWVYKLFPAVTMSQAYYGLAQAWRGPYPDLTVVYAGGLNLKNIVLLRRFDPTGIFCGSALAAKTTDPAAIAGEGRTWLEALHIRHQSLKI